MGGYGAEDLRRRVDEGSKRAGRSDFERDRARVLHSSALRRLADKTQVVDPGDGLGWVSPRTRLTHSLECAQIGRELGRALGADPDLVDAACLAHDLGHPPFGHNGEAALARAAAGCGGFEGNAQSFRLLTRLEAKVVDGSGEPAGLNLTRAALDATVKYPWPYEPGTAKYNAYADDLPAFDWARRDAPPGRRCFEAQLMDWADDVAYSVHDLEDGLHAGHLTPAVLRDRAQWPQVCALAARDYCDAEPAELAEVLDRLLALPSWPAGYDGGPATLAALKNLTSELIGRFATAAESATRERFGGGPLTRYAADLIVPRAQRLECALLKAVTARYVLNRGGVSGAHRRQRELLTGLVESIGALAAAGHPQALDGLHRRAYQCAVDDAARSRVVIDQVASLTDTSAPAWYHRLGSR